MTEEERSRRLGRGLSALLGEEGGTHGGLGPRTVSVALIHPSSFQPRHRFDEAEVESLAASIRQKGLLQPILVRRAPDGLEGYEIVAGERRWRAAQRAGLHELPVIVKELSPSEALEVALIENIQREDLGPLEEAEAYQRLIAEFAYTQEQLAKDLGKSRSHLANMMRLLALPAPVKEMLSAGRISAGHARALLMCADPARLARLVVERGYNVRQTEALVKRETAPAKGRATPRSSDPETAALEAEVSSALGLKIRIRHGRGERGEVRIRYQSLEQLDDICRRLRQDGTLSIP